MKLKEIAERIHAHLKRIEADKVLNVSPGQNRQLLFHAGAIASGRYVLCMYISFEGRSSLTKDEALRYLAKLDAGYVGRHYEALREEPAP